MSRTSMVVIAAFAATLASAGCSSDAVLGTTEAEASFARGADDGRAGQSARVRCELRKSAGRSKVSVDGNDLRPIGGLFRARIRSGANTAMAGPVRAVGDEAEFDFDSAPDDIAAGATAIARTFIRVGPGPDVTAEILNANGLVVATGSADCEVR